MASVERFLAACESHVGTVESPSGSNCNPFSKQLGRPCEAWCADALVAVADEVGLRIPGRSAFTPTLADSYRLAGRWSHEPRLGAWGFVDFPDRHFGIQHVVAVRGILGDSILTYEGNTSSSDRGSQDNGGGFYAKERPRAWIVGYGLPAYEAEPLVIGPGARIVPEEEIEMATVCIRPQGGYYVVQHDGGVFTYEGAEFFGSIPDHPEWNVGGNVVGMAVTRTGKGYWISTRDGAIYSFGDAVHHGAFNTLPPDVRGNRLAVGLIPVGNGYKQILFDPSNDGTPYDGYEFAA